MGKVSITFDPFMYLTLPLPVEKKWSHTIYYIPWDQAKPHVEVCSNRFCAPSTDFDTL